MKSKRQVGETKELQMNFHYLIDRILVIMIKDQQILN